MEKLDGDGCFVRTIPSSSLLFLASSPQILPAFLLTHLKTAFQLVFLIFLYVTGVRKASKKDPLITLFGKALFPSRCILGRRTSFKMAHRDQFPVASLGRRRRGGRDGETRWHKTREMRGAACDGQWKYTDGP